MTILDRAALLLAIVGGVNWGLVGISASTWWPGSAADKPPSWPGLSTPWWGGPPCGACPCSSGPGPQGGLRQKRGGFLPPLFSCPLQALEEGEDLFPDLLLSPLVENFVAHPRVQDQLRLGVAGFLQPLGHLPRALPPGAHRVLSPASSRRGRSLGT